MQRITIEVEQYSDLQLLLRLAERIGLRVIAPAPEEVSPQARKNHLAVIERGGDTSYIEDPVAWQREQREDRELPFRD